MGLIRRSREIGGGWKLSLEGIGTRKGGFDTTDLVCISCIQLVVEPFLPNLEYEVYGLTMIECMQELFLDCRVSSRVSMLSAFLFFQLTFNSLVYAIFLIYSLSSPSLICSDPSFNINGQCYVSLMPVTPFSPVQSVINFIASLRAVELLVIQFFVLSCLFLCFWPADLIASPHLQSQNSN